VSAPGEHKIVQARSLAYAGAIGWTFVYREEAEQRRGFDSDLPLGGKNQVPVLRVDDQVVASCCAPEKLLRFLRAFLW
jgi:type I restriction enzyme R subunit